MEAGLRTSGVFFLFFNFVKKFIFQESKQLVGSRDGKI